MALTPKAAFSGVSTECPSVQWSLFSQATIELQHLPALVSFFDSWSHSTQLLLVLRESCPADAYQVFRQWPTEESPYTRLGAFSHACLFSSVLCSASSSHLKASNYKSWLLSSLKPSPNVWLYLLTFWSRECTSGQKTTVNARLVSTVYLPSKIKVLHCLLVNFSNQLPHTFYLVL